VLSKALYNLVVSVLCFQCGHLQLFCITNTHTNSICSLKANATARSSSSEQKPPKKTKTKKLFNVAVYLILLFWLLWLFSRNILLGNQLLWYYPAEQ